MQNLEEVQQYRCAVEYESRIRTNIELEFWNPGSDFEVEKQSHLFTQCPRQLH